MTMIQPHGDKRAMVQSLKAQGKSISDIVTITGLAKPTVYAYSRPDAAPKTAAKKFGKSAAPAKSGLSGSLTITVQSDGTFLVKVPADRLKAVAKALA
jgi:phospholipase/lecithinase/hemolysin